MTKTKPSALLLQWNLGASVLSLCLNRRGTWVAAALAGGSVALALAEDAGEEPQIVTLGDGDVVSLVADADAHAFLALSSSGKIFIVEPQIAAPTFLVEKEGISHVITGHEGQRFFSVASSVYTLDEEGGILSGSLKSSGAVHGLALSPDGQFLAASHEEGVSLFSLSDKKKREFSSDVACLDLLWSADEKYLIAAGEDSALRVWPQDDGQRKALVFDHQKHQAPPYSFGFTYDGAFFASSGARQGALWPLPFAQGSSPRWLGGADRRIVTQVAPHPHEPLLVLGYDDGMLVLSPLDGRTDIMIHAPVAPSGARVTGLCWNARGDSLMASLESGWLMLFTQKSVMRAVQTRVR